MPKSQTYDKPGITSGQALALLSPDLSWANNAVHDDVIVKLKQYQFDALTSFTFNISSGKFEQSTALIDVNNSNFGKVSTDMLLFNKTGGQYSQGVVNRRKKEGVLFANGTY